MRVYDLGCFFLVRVSRSDVRSFKDRWPCRGLPTVPISFEFDKRNGDLVDVLSRPDSVNFDGPALLALSQDAQAYGLSRLAKLQPKEGSTA